MAGLLRGFCLKFKIMTDKIKIGDKVIWMKYPQIKSTVERIERSRFTGVKIYVCTNGCRFKIGEIKKAE